MATKKFLIAPVNSGLQTNVKPWLIADDAFASMNNAYTYQGRVKKRFGSYLMNTSVDTAVQPLYSRLRINVGMTDGAGDLSGTVPGTKFKVGQLFSIGDGSTSASVQVFTVYQTGTPADMLKPSALITTATFDTTTGDFVFKGALANSNVYWYPSQPVMGLLTYESGVTNAEPVIAFDTQFTYQYTAGAWSLIPGVIFSGSDSQFFWGWTVRNQNASLTVDPLLFVSNFNGSDGIYYYDGSTWTLFAPNTADGSGDYLCLNARIIVQFHGRLLFLNTIESVNNVTTYFPNRCRFSWNGNVIDPIAFRTDLKKGAGIISAATSESIVSAEFIKDRLIVFFERSTWEIVYTGNQVQPFVWQKINTVLGSESTFATVPFDKVIFGIDEIGIHACNGANVERIDQEIPKEVWKIHNNNSGPQRVYGIRDYYQEMVYWTFPDQDNITFPSRVLVYNYRNGTWAFNDDTITCFGYYNRQNNFTWADLSLTWEQWVEPWGGSQLNSQEQRIIAGNHQGFVFIIDTDTTRNAAAMQITNWVGQTITCINHNLSAGDFIYIESIWDYPNSIIQVQKVDDADTITVNSDYVGPYIGEGTIALVSRIDVTTKQYNFFSSEGRNSRVNKVNFLVDTTANGEVTVDYFVSSSSESELANGSATGSLIGTGVLETKPYALYPLESTQSQVWHPNYINADGAFIQLRIYLSDREMADTSIAFSDFQLNAMLFSVDPSSMNLY